MKDNLILGAMIFCGLTAGMLLFALGDLIRLSLKDMAAQKNYSLHVFWLAITTIGFTMFFWSGDIVRLYFGLF